MKPVMKLFIEVSGDQGYLFNEFLKPKIQESIEHTGLKTKDFAIEDLAGESAVVHNAGIRACEQFINGYKWMMGLVNRTAIVAARPVRVRVDVVQGFQAHKDNDDFLSTPPPQWLVQAIVTHCLEAMSKAATEHAKRLVADWMYDQATKKKD